MTAHHQTSSVLPAITMTRSDYAEITRLLDGLPAARQAELENLQEELARAQLVADDALPAGVVRMNSQVTFFNEETEDTVTRRLVYPGPDTAQPNAVSIFNAAGSALIGLSVNQVINWPLSEGRHARLRVLVVE